MPVGPAYSAEVAGTFADSTAAVVTIAKRIGLILVALAPWLPFALVAGLLLRFVLRWAGARRDGSYRIAVSSTCGRGDLTPGPSQG